MFSEDLYIMSSLQLQILPNRNFKQIKNIIEEMQLSISPIQYSSKRLCEFVSVMEQKINDCIR